MSQEHGLQGSQNTKAFSPSVRGLRNATQETERTPANHGPKQRFHQNPKPAYRNRTNFPQKENTK
eukprot:3405637-Amphidinium_carterae.1